MEELLDISKQQKKEGESKKARKLCTLPSSERKMIYSLPSHKEYRYLPCGYFL